MGKKEFLILSIETSCDETAAAVVANGRQVLSNIIASQISVHQRFGGVVPEIASRKHMENIIPVLQQALDQAEVALEELDAVAVTYGPGLVGALLVGVAQAKAMAYALKIPLIGVHHLLGHIYANLWKAGSKIAGSLFGGIGRTYQPDSLEIPRGIGDPGSDAG